MYFGLEIKQLEQKAIMSKKSLDAPPLLGLVPLFFLCISSGLSADGNQTMLSRQRSAAIRPAVTRPATTKPTDDPQVRAAINAVKILAQQALTGDEQAKQKAMSQLRELRDQQEWEPMLQAVVSAKKATDDLLVQILTELGVAALEMMESSLQKEDGVPVSVWQRLTRQIGKDALPFVVRQATSPSRKARLLAASTLSDFRENVQDVLPVLTQLAHDPEEKVAVHSLLTIQRFYRDALPYAAGFREMAEDDRPNVRTTAIMTLAMIGYAEPAFVDRLVAAAASEQTPLEERLMTFEALERVPATPEILNLLQTAAFHKEPKISQAALTTLQQLGSAASSADAVLFKALKDRNSAHPEKLIQILQYRQSLHEEMEPLLVEYLQDQRKPVQAAAVSTLAKIEQLQARSVQAVMKLADDEEVIIRMNVVAVLLRYKDHEGVAEVLRRRSVEEKHPRIRVALLAATQPEDVQD